MSSRPEYTLMPKNRLCTLCGKRLRKRLSDTSTWWNLKNYYGITGEFCETCYSLVEHDPRGNPKDESGYAYAVGALLL